MHINQATLAKYLAACNAWSDDEKRKVIIAVGECGHHFDLGSNTPYDLGVDIYEVNSLPGYSLTMASLETFPLLSLTIWTIMR